MWLATWQYQRSMSYMPIGSSMSTGNSVQCSCSQGLDHSLAYEALHAILVSSSLLVWKASLLTSKHSFSLSSPLEFQLALKGANLRGQTEPKRGFSLIFADSRLFLENIAFGKRRLSQKTADFHRKPQKTAENRRNPQKTQIGVCRLTQGLKHGPLGVGLFRIGTQTSQ